MIQEASRAIVARASLLEDVSHAIRHLGAKGRLVIDGPMSPPEQRLDWLKGLSFALTVAEPFYVANDPCELIAVGARSIPPWPLRLQELPALHGFCMFARPMLTAEGVMTALLWSLVTAPGAKPPEVPRIEDSAGIDLFWFDEHGQTKSGFWKFGDTSSPAGTEADKHFATLVAFAKQKVLVQERSGGDRASRRLSERLGIPEQTTVVVILRKGHSRQSHDEQRTEVEWSCRWWVSGHWRQQPCGPGLMSRRPTWVTPHIKGPEYKPIRTSGRLFAVAR